MAAGKKLSTQEFVERAGATHHNKYNYSESVYVNSHTRLTIVCPAHGKFDQLPYTHLQGNGCMSCSGKQRTSQSDFVSRAKQAIGEQYDFSDSVYKNLSTQVTVICPDHGEFTKSPRLILQQHRGCPHCGQDRYRQKVKNSTLTTQQFVDKARVVHTDNYIYDQVVYIQSSTKVSIICPTHGEFLQTPNNHLRGQGCPDCGNLRSAGSGGYTEQLFDNDPDKKDVPALLYLMEVTNGNEHFLKIGITIKTITERFNRSEYKNMTFAPIHTWCVSLYEAFCLERQIIESLSSHRFFSNTKFSGYTECFKLSALDQVIDMMNDISHSAS